MLVRFCFVRVGHTVCAVIEVTIYIKVASFLSLMKGFTRNQSYCHQYCKHWRWPVIPLNSIPWIVNCGWGAIDAEIDRIVYLSKAFWSPFYDCNWGIAVWSNLGNWQEWMISCLSLFGWLPQVQLFRGSLWSYTYCFWESVILRC